MSHSHSVKAHSYFEEKLSSSIPYVLNLLKRMEVTGAVFAKLEPSLGKSFLSSKAEELICCIYRCPQPNIESHYYIASQTEAYKLGEGSFGAVYKAFPIDVKTGKLLKNHNDEVKEFILKVLQSKQQDLKYVQVEADFLKQLYITEDPIQDDAEIYLISEFKEGINFRIEANIHHPELDALTFMERLNLINRAILNLNLMHNNTPATGPAFTHSDIKIENIRLSPALGSISFVDFGLVQPVADYNNPESLSPISSVNGSTVNIAPEMKDNVQGTKSDVYALTPIIAFLLGEQDPYKYKDAAINQYRKHIPIHVHYHFPDILDNVSEIPDFSFDIKKLIIKFLYRMQSTYHTRPSSDEILRFFITLEKLGRLYENKNKDEVNVSDKNCCLAILFLISEGLWKFEIGKKETTLIKGNIISTQEDAKSYADFDFEGQPIKTSIIVLLLASNITDVNFFEMIHLDTLHAQQFCEAIIILNKKNILTEENVTALSKSLPLCSAFKKNNKNDLFLQLSAVEFIKRSLSVIEKYIPSIFSFYKTTTAQTNCAIRLKAELRNFPALPSINHFLQLEKTIKEIINEIKTAKLEKGLSGQFDPFYYEMLTLQLMITDFHLQVKTASIFLDYINLNSPAPFILMSPSPPLQPDAILPSAPPKQRNSS